MSGTIGFVGVGDMGGPMARNLVKGGFDVLAYDIRSEALDGVTQSGVRAAGSVREIAAAAETVLVCLNTVQAAHAVAQEAAHGAAIRTYVDLSTTGPTVAKEVRQYFENTDIDMLDAPVSGLISGAVEGTLSVMATGSKTAFDRVRPAFEAIGKNVFYLGDIPGGGQTMKLVNNYLMNIANIGTSEAIVLGAKAGLDPRAMFEVINVSTGRNTPSSQTLNHAVPDRDFSYGAFMPISHKDISLCLEEGDRLGVPLELGAVVRDIIADAIDQGGATERSSGIFKYIEAKAGIVVGKDGGEES